jgi:four helix bundle protein
MQIRSYRDLKVWSKAIELVVESYSVSRRFPKSETYGLCSQLQKAAVSIPANIAEGHGRDHLGDYLHHLSVANGSLMELETHFVIAHRLDYLRSTELDHLLALTGEVSRMLSGLSRNLRSHERANSPLRNATPANSTPNT